MVVENALRMIQTRLFPCCEYPWSWQVVCSFYFHKIHLLCHLSGQDLAVHVQSYCWIEVGIPKLMLLVENPLQHQQTKIYKPLTICKIPMCVSWESSDVIAPFPKKQNRWLQSDFPSCFGPVRIYSRNSKSYKILTLDRIGQIRRIRPTQSVLSVKNPELDGFPIHGC